LKTIVLFGSGRSAPSLIKYLLEISGDHHYEITIADINDSGVQKYSLDNPNCHFIKSDVTQESQRNKLVQGADLVISMVPARFHALILTSCIRFKKDLITPSYETKEMKDLVSEIKSSGILVINELGLDPGIDHLSAMKVIDEIRHAGDHLTAFESFTGGLMAPGYDNNPWQYKFTWNPRNVVLAGQGGAVRFLHNGKFKYIPYSKIFRRTEKIEIENFGTFEGYANRDSLGYIEKYGLNDISTIYRGTLRRPGFCRAWDLLVQLGVTDDSYQVEGSEDMTFREFINSFLPYNPHDSVELKLMHYLKIDQDSGLMEKLRFLGLFTNEKIGIPNATPAQILEHILKKAWTMSPHDKDMIVMWHKFFYQSNSGDKYQRTSSLVALGEGSEYTAMAKTVGLPMGIAAKHILQNSIKLKGLHLPVKPEIYHPILKELEQHGIVFKDKTEILEDYVDNGPIF